MLFTSDLFLFIFFPGVLIISKKLKGQWLLGWLLFASLGFYALQGQPWFVIPLAITISWDYFLAIQIEQAASPRPKKALLAVSLLGNIGLLMVFKYGRFLGDTVAASFRYLRLFPAHSWEPSTSRWLLPIGISFYTFQTLSYILDVYRGQAPAERNFLKFACFVSFFPHLVAGPLTRHNQLIPGLEEISEKGVHPRWEEGVFLFAIGLCKKHLLADRLGEAVNLLLISKFALGLVSGWLALLGFGLQIYFDFSAYTDMAIGLGRLLGVELPQNFNDPYKAINPSDFWRRWHITLSRWIQDYLFIPLCLKNPTPPGMLMSLIITMFLAGLWHGARWTFAVWGLYHGTLLLLYHLTQPLWDRAPRWIQRAATLVLINLGWIFFRSDSFDMAKDWWEAALGMKGLQWSGLFVIDGWLILLLLLGMAIAEFAPTASRFDGFKTLTDAQQVILGVLTVLAILYINHSSAFLYFQF